MLSQTRQPVEAAIDTLHGSHFSGLTKFADFSLTGKCLPILQSRVGMYHGVRKSFKRTYFEWPQERVWLSSRTPCVDPEWPGRAPPARPSTARAGTGHSTSRSLASANWSTTEKLGYHRTLMSWQKKTTKSFNSVFRVTVFRSAQFYGQKNYNWLLVRVTLVVPLVFLPQNFARLTRALITCHNDVSSGHKRVRATFVKLSQNLIVQLSNDIYFLRIGNIKLKLTISIIYQWIFFLLLSLFCYCYFCLLVR